MYDSSFTPDNGYFQIRIKTKQTKELVKLDYSSNMGVRLLVTLKISFTP